MPTLADAKLTEAVPFLHVLDMPSSIAFYVDGLGFELARSWEPEGRLRWCRLESGSAALMLQEYLPNKRPGSPRGVGTSFNFTCADALVVHELALARGLAHQEPFVGNGLWVVGFTDPDGYRLEFASVTDAPEDVTLSEWQARKG